MNMLCVRSLRIRSLNLPLLCRCLNIWGSKTTDLNKVVSEAEKVVGYPPSFMSLRCLLSDELSNVAIQMRKLVGTKHPLLKTARKFFYDGKHSLQMRGLLVLLVSKAADSISLDASLDKVTVEGIHQSQRNLAEITEMIYTAHLIHKGVVNIDNISLCDGPVSEMTFGNKMAILSGDFLLANASTGLAELNNTQVVEIMSSAIGDLTEAEFTTLRDAQGCASIPSNGFTTEDWIKQTYLSSGSLLAKSCQSTLKLAKHSQQYQDAAYEFGKSLAFAHQIKDEVQSLQPSSDDNGNGFSITSLPIAVLYEQNHFTKEVEGMSLNQLNALVVRHNIISVCKKMSDSYQDTARKALHTFPPNAARSALDNIVSAMAIR